MILSAPKIDEGSIIQLAQYAEHTETLEINLTDVEWITPAGIVCLAIIAECRTAKGLWTHVRPPADDDVLNYLGRIDFFRYLSQRVVVDEDLSHLEKHDRNRSHRFTELLPVSERDASDICDVVSTFFERQFSTRWRQAYRPFEEVISNIKSHASFGLNSAAFARAHVQRYSNRLELAFADLGVGFLQTLSSNPHHSHLSSEEAALRGAFEKGLSRFHRSDDEHRGGGLRGVGDTTRRLGGRIVVRTGNGLLSQTENGRRHYRTLSDSFPGSFVWIRLPAG
jgi:hypothetical protein